MTKETDFDLASAHRYFSTTCFNAAWELIVKEDRTGEDDQEMMQLNQASIWHWTQREDCTDKNLSIGYWQASRIHALLGFADAARRYGQLSLGYGKDQGPFYHGYAYEALARAELVAGDMDKTREYLAQAADLAAMVEKEEDKKYLLADLATIG